MIFSQNLPEIEKNRLESIFSTLDALLTLTDRDGRLLKVISGYNYYSEVFDKQEGMILTHMHDTDAYKEAMIADLAMLGYSKPKILSSIRGRVSSFVHDLDFRIRADSGEVFRNLRVRDVRTALYLDLNLIAGTTLTTSEFRNSEGRLLSEVTGWELNLLLMDESELM